MTANPLPPVSAIGVPTGMAGPAGGTGPFKPIEPMRVLRQNLRLLIITAIGGVMLGVATWAVLRYTYPIYRSEAILTVKGEMVEPMAVSGGDMPNRMEAVEAFMANQVAILTSETILNNVLGKDEVKRMAWAQRFMGANGVLNSTKAREELLDTLSAVPVRGSTMIKVSISDTHGDEVQNLLRHLLLEYHALLTFNQSSQTALVKGMFSQMLTANDSQIKNMERLIQSFMENEGITANNANQTQAYAELSRLSIEHAEAEANLRAAAAAYEALLGQLQNDALAPSAEEEIYLLQTPAIAEREEKKRLLREQRGVLLLRLKPEHDQIKSLDQNIVMIDSEIQRERTKALRELRAYKLEAAVKAYEGAQAAVEAILPQFRAAELKLVDINVKLEQLAQLQRRLELAQEHGDQISDLLKDIDAIERRDDAKRVSTSVPPTEAEMVFPKPELVVPGVTMLLLLAVGGLVFLREMLDQRIKTPADVKLLADVELLGMLPDSDEDPLGQNELAGAVRRDPAGLLAESFRQVRTSLLTRMDRRGYKTLMLVGAQPACGVSVVTANLAASLAFNGRKVLVLDANLRRPSQCSQFSINPSAPGLADVLAGRADADNVIVTMQDPRIDVLPAGSTAGAYPEQLEGQPFRNLLATLESRYDIILIDAPPALLTSDAALLAKQVDAVAIVVRAMQQKRGMIDRMLRQLDGHRADVLGVILNGVRSSAGGYFRKSYKAFYEYSSNGNGHAAKNGRTAAKPRRAIAPAPTTDADADRAAAIAELAAADNDELENDASKN